MPSFFRTCILLVCGLTGFLTIGAQPLDTYRQRQAWMADWMAKNYYIHDNGYDAKGGAATCDAILSINGDTVKAYHALYRYPDQSMDMFDVSHLAQVYARHGYRFPDSLKTKFQTKMKAQNYFNNGTTENHRLMYKTAGFLTAEAFGDWNGVLTHCRGELLTMMNKQVRFGVVEYDSPTYETIYLNCFRALADCAQDSEIRQRAALTFEWHLIHLASAWLKGYYNSASLRNYRPISGSPHNPASALLAGWIYFNGMRTPAISTGWDAVAEPNLLVSILSSGWTLPDYIAALAQNRTDPFVMRSSQAIEQWANEARKYSYTHPEYALFSQFDGNGNLGWPDQAHRWAVRWVSNNPNSTFFIHHPKGSIGGNGITPYEQVLQHEGTLIGVCNIPASNAKPFLAAQVDMSAVVAHKEQGGWLFLHGGNTCIGARFLRGYVWEGSSVIKSAHVKNGYLIETAPSSAYTGTNAQQLDAFAAAVIAATVIDSASIGASAPAFSYRGLSGKLMSITYNASGYGGYNGNRTVDGVAYDYARYPSTWPLIENPWASQMVGGAKLTLTAAGKTVVYDFDTWTKTILGANQPDLVVTDILTNPADLLPNQPATLSAVVKNQGDAALAAGSQCTVEFRVNGTVFATSAAITRALNTGDTMHVAAQAAWAGGPRGVYRIAATIDPENRVAESVEDNNSFVKSIMVAAAVSGIGQLEAEAYDEMSGLQTEGSAEGTVVSWIDPGDWLAFYKRDFGTGASQFQVRVACAQHGGTIEVRKGGPQGALCGSVPVSLTGGWSNYVTLSGTLTGLSGVQDLYIAFKGTGSGLFNVNWFRFLDQNYPDLVIGDIQWTPAVASAGESIAISALVRNIGLSAVPLSANVMVSFVVDGQILSEVALPADLAPGSMVALTAPALWSLKTAESVVAVVADSAARIAELVEDNNRLSRTLRPLGSWASRDIGDVGLAGSASWDNDGCAILGAGLDIWNTNDNFHFSYLPIGGNVTLTARVTGVEPNTSQWGAKAGVMIRESLAPGAKNVFVKFHSGGGASATRRTSTGGSTSNFGSPQSTPLPGWVRVTRTDSTFECFSSSDGQSWTSLGSTTLHMSLSVYAGLAVTSISKSKTCRSTFEKVSLVAGKPSSFPTEVGQSGLAPHTHDANVGVSIVKGILRISNPEGAPVSGVVFDLAGRQVMTFAGPSTAGSLFVPMSGSGVWVVRVQAGKRTIIQKISAP